MNTSTTLSKGLWLQQSERRATRTAMLLLLLLLILPAVVRAQVWMGFGYTFNNDGTVTITGYIGPGGAVTIPGAINGSLVSSIGGNAFGGCGRLTSVTIPGSVTSIGIGAFSSCTGLTSLIIPDSVTIIGSEAFSSCSALTNVAIGSGVTNIGDCAFGNCNHLTTVTIPSSVTGMERAFLDCTSLTAITVDALNPSYSNVDGVLFDKNQTTLIEYPGGKAGAYVISNIVTSIGDAAFAGCTSLTSVTIPSSVTNIGYEAFTGSSLTSVTIDGVTSMEWQAFCQCPSLTNVTIANGVASMGDDAFASCTSLRTVTIPNGVIGNHAFDSCSSLTSATIGNGVTNIGIGPFSQCASLTAIAVDELNPVYSSVEGVLFNKSQTTLLEYPVGKTETSYTISNSVTSIGDYAFDSCASLTSVSIPNSVTSIGDGVFSDCASLTSITIGNGVTSIGQGMFAGCTKLANVTISSSVTSIGEQAFAGTLLTRVTIPASVTSIGDQAFGWCSNLLYVNFKGNAPRSGSDIFFWDATYLTVYYLAGTTGWGMTFGGCRTAQWLLPNPLILNNSFGVQTNGFGFIISWARNIPVAVDACTNLANPTSWSPISTNTLTNGSSYFSDPQWKNYPARFYRLRSP